jgi:hypothetical protein
MASDLSPSYFSNGRALAYRALVALAGVASAWPLVYLVYLVWLISSLETDAVAEPPLSLHLFTLALVLTLVGAYLAMLYRSTLVPSGRRTFWALVLLIGNVFALPVFWYVFLWRRAADEPAAEGCEPSV